MSLPNTGYGTVKKLRQASIGSGSSPRLIPRSSDSYQDGLANPLLNVVPTAGRERANSISSVGSREPTRSSVHLSYRGSHVPVDNHLQVARSVREDTAELASYALSDRASTRSLSPPRHRTRSSRHAQTSIDSYFQSEHDGEPVDDSDAGRHETIQEVSEPVSPESRVSKHSPRGSIIADQLRQSPQQMDAEDDSDTDSSISETMLDEDVSSNGRLIITQNGVQRDTTERTPLISNGAHKNTRHPDWIHGEQDVESQAVTRKISWPKLRDAAEKGADVVKIVFHPKRWSGRSIVQGIKMPFQFLPAVVLGILLNILDALSYGMILFPLGQPIFQNLGPAGISMFYVSTIISQLVFSCGGSIFKGGIGSEMIEVVPFFHKMAFTIMEEVGEDKPDAVIATTITAYATSSVITGIVFFLMGYFNFGYIVGFIPRHILIGCIGGVGWFLVATGFEVTARLDSNLNYDLDTLKKMFETDTVPLWVIPLVLAIILFTSQEKVHSKYYLPTFILMIPAVFYFFVASIDELQVPSLRRQGWIFSGPESDEPWWYFWTLYKFHLVDWAALLKTVPAMFALTFFGLLHAPINVPSLAFRVGEDNLNLDRELIAHGISNALSGFAGSIQNYLVYTNSLIFIKGGGDSRVAGVMLAFATFGILIIGPGLIGYIPVMMVGVLIFTLGIELVIEAVWLPRNKLKRLEYWTVLTIVVVMGVHDFVVGIFVGIGLAFVSFVVQTSRVPAVRASYSGEIAGSTVRRNPAQSRYLREAGRQVHITKLAGYLFFGTIVSVEERIRRLIEEEAFNKRPIRFLIFDLYHVTGMDYSAAEAFNRLNRVFNKKGVTLVLSGVNIEGELGRTLLAVGLGQEGEDGGDSVDMLTDLNSALESCENELLKTYYTNKDDRIRRHASPDHLDVPSSGKKPSATYSIDAQFSSPRRSQLQRMATMTLDEHSHEARYTNFKEPLRLILQTFTGLTDKNEDFWFRVTPFFARKEYIAGTVLYRVGEAATGFYLVQEGVLRADYQLPQGYYFESIVAGTTCGELPFFSETDRTATVAAERDCIAWLMDREAWERLQKEDAEVARELLRIGLKLTSERMSSITSYVLTTAG